ncbi:APH domain-containing protein [Durusdinium trenchii]|uniref:APH domain-containing protein n=1 Tax=Durusdinium trenchii TaxID=1381693 RepID=A0ABP0RK59_9DINO
MYVVDDGHMKVVVSIPSWTGLELRSKILASECLGQTVGPRHLATLEGEGGRRLLVNEFLEGGTLNVPDLTAKVLRDVGQLYAQLHRTDTSWFDPVREELARSGDLHIEGCDWTFCLWVLPRLQCLVPEANREELHSRGDPAREKQSSALVPPWCCQIRCPALPQACVHGDAHLGNIMWHEDRLRLIDFDMTAPGPAGADLAYLVLMLFRCGFSRDAVADLNAQKEFARGYLTGLGELDEGPRLEEQLEEFLFEMHRWAYVGMIQMGLLCAVLMHNEGHPQKRELMQLRGPVLLHPSFLSKAKDMPLEIIQEAILDTSLRAEVLEQGLFFVTEARWTP